MGILRPKERNGVDVDIPWNPEATQAMVSLSILNPVTTQAGARSPAAGPQEEEGPGLTCLCQALSCLPCDAAGVHPSI